MRPPTPEELERLIDYLHALGPLVQRMRVTIRQQTVDAERRSRR